MPQNEGSSYLDTLDPYVDYRAERAALAEKQGRPSSIAAWIAKRRAEKENAQAPADGGMDEYIDKVLDMSGMNPPNVPIPATKPDAAREPGVAGLPDTAIPLPGARPEPEQSTGDVGEVATAIETNEDAESFVRSVPLETILTVLGAVGGTVVGAKVINAIRNYMSNRGAEGVQEDYKRLPPPDNAIDESIRAVDGEENLNRAEKRKQIGANQQKLLAPPQEKLPEPAAQLPPPAKQLAAPAKQLPPPRPETVGSMNEQQLFELYQANKAKQGTFEDFLRAAENAGMELSVEDVINVFKRFGAVPKVRK